MENAKRIELDEACSPKPNPANLGKKERDVIFFRKDGGRVAVVTVQGKSPQDFFELPGHHTGPDNKEFLIRYKGSGSKQETWPYTPRCGPAAPPSGKGTGTGQPGDTAPQMTNDPG